MMGATFPKSRLSDPHAVFFLAERKLEQSRAFW